MPTLLKIYSNHQTNRLVTTTVEYAVKQFYLMNRKPFILQMFGSVSAMLDTDEEGTYGDAHKVCILLFYFANFLYTSKHFAIKTKIKIISDPIQLPFQSSLKSRDPIARSA